MATMSGEGGARCALKDLACSLSLSLSVCSMINCVHLFCLFSKFHFNVRNAIKKWNFFAFLPALLSLGLLVLAWLSFSYG